MRTRTAVLLVGGVILIIVAAGLSVILNSVKSPTVLLIGNGNFQAQVVKTNWPTHISLSGTDAVIIIPKAAGRLAVPTADLATASDIVWINAQKKVVAMSTNVTSSSGMDGTLLPPPMVSASYVIVLPAGSVNQEAIEQNQVVVFDLPVGDAS